jgi:hypothetical protein
MFQTAIGFGFSAAFVLAVILGHSVRTEGAPTYRATAGIDYGT